MRRILSPDELLDWMPEAFNAAENAWAQQFCRSMIRNASNPNWQPTPKQRAMMQRMVSQLPEFDDFGPVIMRDDESEETGHEQAFA